MSNRRSKCKHCGAEIEFVRSQRGKWVPLNPNFVDLEDLDVDLFVAAEDGYVCKVDRAREIDGSNRWRVSHFGTCDGR